MSEKPFDFFQDHSRNYLEMAFKAEYSERIENPDGYGWKTGDCGDTVTFFLVHDPDDDRLAHIAFEVDGCRNTTACANTVVSLALGKPVAAAWEVTPEQIAAFLETLPEDHRHCAELAAGAFYRALADLKNGCRNLADGG